MRILCVLGTRPEAIKMLPLVLELRKHRSAEVLVCDSGQHRELSKNVFEFFGVEPDFSMNIMRQGQTLGNLTVRMLQEFETIFEREKFDLVLVHGDTTTAFCAALSAFYKGIKIGHIEAGLRTYNSHSPYPEEFNRVAVDAMSDLLFAPTALAQKRLENEGRKGIYTVGNTVIDALLYTVAERYFSPILGMANGRKILLVTMHRRENLGEKMHSSMLGIKDILLAREDLFGVFPMHPNPRVREVCKNTLSDVPNIELCEPFSLCDFHNILSRSTAVLTDSGGVQEEAAFLGIPLFLLRDTTEREEGKRLGNIRLVGCERERIKNEFLSVFDDSEKLAKMRTRSLVFGDGHACERIAKIILS